MKDLCWSSNGGGNDLEDAGRPPCCTGVPAVGNEAVRVEHAGLSFSYPERTVRMVVRLGLASDHNRSYPGTASITLAGDEVGTIRVRAKPAPVKSVSYSFSVRSRPPAT